jgi:hypothetical protein
MSGFDLPGLIAFLFTLLLAALVAALILRKDFRDAVLGGTGEATFFRILTVRGVAIVVLCGLMIGGIVFSLSRSGLQESPTIELIVHFEPDEVNPRNQFFSPTAFIRTPEGPEAIPLVYQVQTGALSIRLTPPDMKTPFFIVFDTPNGTWKTDDYSIHQAVATAHKQELD